MSDTYKTGKMIPIQAYVDEGVVRTFRHRYRRRGAMSRLIRDAVEIAITEDAVQEVEAQRAVERLNNPLPHAPSPRTTQFTTCGTCNSPNLCLAMMECRKGGDNVST